MARHIEPEGEQRRGHLLGVIMVVACLVPCAAPLGLVHLRGALAWGVAALALLTLLLLDSWRTKGRP